MLGLGFLYSVLRSYSVLSISHKNTSLEDVGRFHMEHSDPKLKSLKINLGLSELYYLSTCNRVEFYGYGKISEEAAQVLCDTVLDSYPGYLVDKIRVYQGEIAARHLFQVASSLDSLVVGEREIITQVRTSFEKSKKNNLSGDLIRLLLRKTIETAKRIYTETNIATNPVSVVSLAYRKLRNFDLPLDANIVVVGSGITNTTLCRFLRKHGFKNFKIYNRTLSNAESLAEEIGGSAHPLSELKDFNGKCDILLSCTSAPDSVITSSIFERLKKENSKRIVAIDLAIPHDISARIPKEDMQLININELRDEADKNIKMRESELEKCEEIIDECFSEFKGMYAERKVERLMKDVPTQIKEIRRKTQEEVFGKDWQKLDEESQELISKMLDYMEKKCISIPMKTAKQIMLDKSYAKHEN